MQIEQSYFHTAVQTLEAQLTLCGVTPDEVNYLMPTHMHWDHARNVTKSMKAKVIAQDKELEGVKILSVPGHAVGLRHLQLTDGDCMILFTSDACYTKVNWDNFLPHMFGGFVVVHGFFEATETYCGADKGDCVFSAMI